MQEESKFYIIREEVLSEALKKTILAKELLETGQAKTINDAVKMAGLSRSAFYKYKNYIFPYSKFSKGKIVTLSLLLEHMPGILSSILDIIAMMKGNVITINQSMPSLGVASVSISIDTQYMVKSIEALIEKIEKEHGVRKVEILGE
ncbi:ACT domain-containing protein [Thermoanaerobacterium thermosaccharolyticum]|uniref:ACT domain-containing protein n=1 Tax=Thermoanaerobacterium thermosaccharolyticum TaxID=1517 RepID=UPI003DAA2ED7